MTLLKCTWLSFLDLGAGALLRLIKLCVLLVFKQYCYIIQSLRDFKTAGRRITPSPAAESPCCGQWLRRQKGFGAKCQLHVFKSNLLDSSYFWSELNMCAYKVVRESSTEGNGCIALQSAINLPMGRRCRDAFFLVFHFEK